MGDERQIYLPARPWAHGTPNEIHGWQVFGLSGKPDWGAYWALLPNPVSPESVHFIAASVEALRRSFLITAAGQFRFYTGFPLSPPTA